MFVGLGDKAKRNTFSIRPSFGIQLAGWRFFIYSFSFENYESDIDRVIYLRSCIVTFCWSENQIDRRILMKRNSNWCTSIVAFWWSEIQIDRRIVIERNSNWYIVESRELERRRVCRVSPFESEDEYIESHDESEDEYVESCDYLVERRWVYRIS